MERTSFFSRLGRRLSRPARKGIALAVRTAACVGLMLGITAALWISLALARAAPRLAVLTASAAVGCLSFVLALTALPLLRKLFRSDEKELQDQIRRQEEEIARLRTDKESAEEKAVDFQRRITLLENLTFNIETYRDVFKVCFRDYQQEATIKRHERFNEEDGGPSGPLSRILGRQGKSYDEVLSVMDCAISYQRGVDLQKIKIAKVNNSTVVVSGLGGEYMTPPRFDYKDFFSEVRHVKLDKNGEVRRISVENSEYYERELRKKQGEYKAAFEDSFLNGKDSDDSEEIIRRAEDFIRIILQPIYAHVEFDSSLPASDSQDLLDFLRGETGLYKALLEKQTADRAKAALRPALLPEPTSRRET